MTTDPRSTAYQTAAHAAALDAARAIVARLEAEGPLSGWYTDRQALAIGLMRVDGRDEAEVQAVAEALHATHRRRPVGD